MRIQNIFLEKNELTIGIVGGLIGAAIVVALPIAMAGIVPQLASPALGAVMVYIWGILLWVAAVVLGVILRGSAKGMKMGLLMGIFTGVFTGLFLSIVVPTLGGSPPGFIIQLQDLGVISPDSTFDQYDVEGCLLFGILVSVITMFGGSVGGTLRPE